MNRLSAVAFVLATSPLLAQQTGVSHPAETVDETPLPQATSTSIPVVTAPVVVVAPAYSAESQDSSPAVTLQRHDLAKFTPDSALSGGVMDSDSGIVEAAAPVPGLLPAGTLVRARLRNSIATATTATETPFSAQLTEPVLHMGRTVFPVGSTVEGRVTEIHGGRRFRGPALIHLQAQTIILPDGTRLPLSAAVIDTDQYGRTRIDSEGNIVRKDHALQTFGEFSLATGSGAAAGGLLGGAPGALIGAGVGAGVGTAVWLKQDRQTSLPSETLVVLSLTAPLAFDAYNRTPEFVRTNPAPVETELPPPVTLKSRSADASAR